jgi:hypothetical protein
MRSGPLAVGIGSETAIRLLSGKQRRDPRAGKYGSRVRHRVLAQQLAACQVLHRRFIRRKQPRHRGGRRLVHLARVSDRIVDLVQGGGVKIAAVHAARRGHGEPGRRRTHQVRPPRTSDAMS